MHIFSDKRVKTRKLHRCAACERDFEKGSYMQRQINNFDNHIGAVYTCQTCKTLTDSFSDTFYDDMDGVFPNGCVSEYLENGETPEQLLTRMEAERGQTGK
jgi:DNA-directed RNA polymerase subunit RPC12/RpoP